MSTYVVRPTALLGKDGTIQGTSDSGSNWAAASDANVATYTSDQLDSTGVRPSGSAWRWFQLDLAAPTIPADEFVARVGGLIRWTAAVAGKSIGCLPYVISDGVPGYSSGVSTTVTATPITSQPGYQYFAWTLAQVADLGLQVAIEGDATAGNRPNVWELGASIYTLKQATATPQATTMTTSTRPVVPVATACTIDWEASTPDWYGLRKVTVEVRIETGGTGAGTGTLKSTATADVYFTATGTQTVNVSLPDSLANGTYKIYARAIRHREMETSVAVDQYGAWSAAATLTMNATPPGTPTVTVTPDDTTDRVTIAVTPVASSGYTLPSFTVQRSDDGGLTWTAVRNATNVSAAFGVKSEVIDYEAPRGVTVYYQAAVSAYISGVLNQSAWSTRLPTTVSRETWNLKCPQASNINFVGVTVIGKPSDQITEDLGVFRPLDRKYPVTVSGTLGGWDGDLEIHCGSELEWLSLRALIEAQLVLLLESPFGWAKYVRFLPGAKTTMVGTMAQPRRQVSLQYVETAAPIGLAPVLPDVIQVIIDGGTSATSSWTDTADGGNASTSSWAGLIDGGSVS